MTLRAHATLLRRLIARVEREPAIRFIELSCSLARGVGDELSDLDLGFGIADDHWPDALPAVAGMLDGVGELVDFLEHRMTEWGDVPHRRFFAQYRDSLQVDLVVLPVSLRPGMPVGNVALYDPDRRLAKTLTSNLERATAEEVREWAFLAWIALANVDKYLRRGSAWEALEQIHEARTHVWRLWAVASGVRFPAFGLTSALDHAPPATPARLELTVATLQLQSLRRAALVLASLLGQIAVAAAAAAGAAVPTAMASFISARLAQRDIGEDE